MYRRQYKNGKSIIIIILQWNNKSYNTISCLRYFIDCNYHIFKFDTRSLYNQMSS